MFGNLGTLEIVIIAAVVFLLFGGKKLPEFARGITKAGQEFNKGLRSKDEDEEKDITAKTKKK